jgi:hypothetical protein
MKTKHILLIFSVALAAGLFFSCKKTFDAPPVKSIPTGGFKTIDSLRAWVNKNGKQMVRITADASINLVITADETSGNIYKEVFAIDQNGKGIDVKLMASGGLYLGDSIRLNLNGSTIEIANGQLQIDSVVVDNQVTKVATGKMVAPKVVTISQLDTTYESQLIKINNAEFRTQYQGKTFADVVNGKSTSYEIHECGMPYTAVPYTSNYANFAGQTIPSGNGSIIAIAKRYNNGMELIIRNFAEVQLTNAGCGEVVDTLTENFNKGSFGKDLNSYNGWYRTWYNIAQYGTYLWQDYPKTAAGTNLYAHFSSYPSSAPVDTAWLITPPIKWSATKTLTFQTGAAFWKGDQLEVLVSTDFNGTNMGTAHWTNISSNFTIASSGSGTFNGSNYVNSGTVSLAPLITGTGNFYIGFRYWGSKSANYTTDYYLDNVIIKN